MNKADSERIQSLCALIAVEENRHKFLTLVEELNQILATNDDRLRKNETPDPKRER